MTCSSVYSLLSAYLSNRRDSIRPKTVTRIVFFLLMISRNQKQHDFLTFWQSGESFGTFFLQRTTLFNWRISMSIIPAKKYKKTCHADSPRTVLVRQKGQEKTNRYSFKWIKGQKRDVFYFANDIKLTTFESWFSFFWLIRVSQQK